MSSKENDEECVIDSKSDNVEIIINDEENYVIENFFRLLLYRYQIRLKVSIIGSDFIFDCVHLLYYKCRKINFKHGGSYIDSPNSIKNKKVTINLVNKRHKKCFLYTAAVALSHEEIKKEPQRI